MKKMTSVEIRDMWNNYFKSKGHMMLESAPLVPINDDSLLFVNAGVTPLKRYFDGREVPENKRIVSIQKCIRTNDIENVGMTKRHLTFFEMMGNFSIGDYFKKEALEYALEFLTSKDYAAIPLEKIYVTVYPDDDEAYKRWIELGLPEDHIARLEGNYWEIGEGPCGPDSEIFYDRGEAFDPDGSALEKFRKDEEQERYLEIWNNVFSQYNAESGVARVNYKELPSKNIDTGAGLERWCVIFQDVDSVYDTDLFQPILNKIANIAQKPYDGSQAFKVIADHIRTATVALGDGAIFENTGRGYVLRRLLRRSVRMGKKLGINEPFMYKLVETVVSIMKDSYPDLLANQAQIKTLVFEEEELFHRTLTAGEKRVAQLIEEAKKADNSISGYDVFKLYDTYGFPFELTLEYLDEEGITTNSEEYYKYMAMQKDMSRAKQVQATSMTSQNEELINFKDESIFDYDSTAMTSKVIGLFQDGHMIDKMEGEGYIILDKTCFYAESGGQIADRGAMKKEGAKIKVLDVQKSPNDQHLHKVEIIEGSVALGDSLEIKIMADERLKTMRNHSAIHLMQAALREKLDLGIRQAGSYVDNERFRFDFNYSGKINENMILEIEKLVNEKIAAATDVVIKEMSLDEAKALGALALFEDKYHDRVRVIQMGESIELCGGTHVSNTSQIKNLAIINLESKGSNVYRVEAVTGSNVEVFVGEAVAPYVEEISKILSKAKDILTKAKEEEFVLKFSVELEQTTLDSYQAIIFNRNQHEYVQSEVKKLEKAYKELLLAKNTSDLSQYYDQREWINEFEVIITKAEGFDVKTLKTVVDNLINRLQNGFVFMAGESEAGVNYVCSSKSLIHAGLMMKKAMELAGGNGGGSDKYATGGGKSLDNIDEVLLTVKEYIRDNIKDRE